MTLNTRRAETAKPRDKAYQLADGEGLYLMVNTNGSKYWRMKYRFAGKENKLSFEPTRTSHLLKLALNWMRQKRYWRMIRIPERSIKATQLAKNSRIPMHLKQ